MGEMQNKFEHATGVAKEKVGQATDDQSLENEGRADQIKSDLKDAAGSVKDAAQDAADRVKDAVDH